MILESTVYIHKNYDFCHYVCQAYSYATVGLAKWLPRPTPNRKILGSSPRFDNLSFSFSFPGIILAWHCYVLVVFLNLVVVFYFAQHINNCDRHSFSILLVLCW